MKEIIRKINLFFFSLDPIEDPIQPENVIVPESGEDSEDEWNYIKVNRNANENETQERNIISQETVESQNLCPDVKNYHSNLLERLSKKMFIF